MFGRTEPKIDAGDVAEVEKILEGLAGGRTNPAVDAVLKVMRAIRGGWLDQAVGSAKTDGEERAYYAGGIAAMMQGQEAVLELIEEADKRAAGGGDAGVRVGAGL